MRNIFHLLLFVAIAFCSCETSKVPIYQSNAIDKYYQLAETNDVNTTVGKTNTYADNAIRILIYNAYLSLIVHEPDSVNAKIITIAKKYEGHSVVSGSYQAIIRVRSQYLNNALEDIALLGKIENKNITGNDVTEEYTDYEIRLENARNRYLELLAKAENVTAALLVEKELERLNGEIEILEGKMNKINHLAEFSTITINIHEKVKPGILGYIGIGLYSGVKWLFVRN